MDDVEHLEENVPTVDTFTEMQNMYRPNNDGQLSANNENVEQVDKVEQVEIQETAKESSDLDEYDEEEDVEGSEGSENSEDLDEEEEEDVEEISDVDDDDLMKRLDSKYGKLPEKNSSDEEEIEEKWTSNFET